MQSIYILLLVFNVAEAFYFGHHPFDNKVFKNVRHPLTFHHATTSEDIEEEKSNSCSKLRALKFVQLTKNTNPGLLSDYLMEIGASSVSITDHDKDTPSENPIFAEPDESQEMFAAIICGDAAVGKNLWMRCDVTAHFGDSFDLVGIVDDVRTNFDLATGARYVVDDVPDLDWIKEVQSSWKPFVVGGFLLKFPWHTAEDVQIAIQQKHIERNEGEDENGNYHEILLEGGIAFGTGEHPTTQLCLNWVKQTVEEDKDVKMFLDYGAGSGVLGIGACILNKELKSIGVEIDVDAIRIADQNAKNNDANMQSYLPGNFGGDDESASLIMKAVKRSSVEMLPKEMDGQVFDACAANILAGPLISLSSTIAGMVKKGGKIGLSGILEWQSDEVLEAYKEYFDDVEVQDSCGGWVLITGKRK
jgi:ribosomal protein L11 methyltransferase